MDDYLTTRLHDCGGAPTQAMFEFANDDEVPGAEMDSVEGRAITELFWMIAALDNDRVSRHKEILGQHDPYNLINVLGRVLGLPEPDAMATAIALRDRMMVRFLRLRTKLAARASAPLRTYLDTLGLALRSNIEWSLRTPRYATLYAPDGVTETGHITVRSSCTDTPSDASDEPLPFPSISWWWTQTG